MVKHNLLLPYTYNSSSSTVDLLLHLQYFRHVDPIILKMRVKSKFILWQPRYYKNRSDWKTEKKIHVFVVLIFFENILLLSISRSSIQTPYLDDILLGKFYIVKFNGFSRGPVKVEKRFWNILDWPLVLVILEL